MSSNVVESVKPIESESESDPEVNASFEDASSESEPEPEPTELTTKSLALPTAPMTKPKHQSGSKGLPQQLPSSPWEEKYSGSESEPSSESDGSDPILSLIAAKAREGANKAYNDVLEPRSKTEPTTPAKSTVKKRASEREEPETTDAKRSKKKNVENSDRTPSAGSPKQILFERFFSEADEIAILQGVIGYVDKYGSDPFGDVNAFRNFIKDDLQADPTRDQLWYKMLKFEKKYERNKQKEESGRCRSLKAHERTAYELSKRVWAIENEKGELLVGSSKATKKRGAKKTQVGKKTNNANGSEGCEKNNLNKLAKIVNLKGIVCMDKNTERIGTQLFGGNKDVERENEWRKLTIAEMEVYLKKLELMITKTKLVLDVLKANDY